MNRIIDNFKIYTDEKLTHSDLELIYTIGEMGHVQDVYNELYTSIYEPYNDIYAIKLDYVFRCIYGLPFEPTDREILNDELIARLEILSGIEVEIDVTIFERFGPNYIKEPLLPIKLLDVLEDNDDIAHYVQILKTPFLFEEGLEKDEWESTVKNLLIKKGVFEWKKN